MHQANFLVKILKDQKLNLSTMSLSLGTFLGYLPFRFDEQTSGGGLV